MNCSYSEGKVIIIYEKLLVSLREKKKIIKHQRWCWVQAKNNYYKGMTSSYITAHHISGSIRIYQSGFFISSVNIKEYENPHMQRIYIK